MTERFRVQVLDEHGYEMAVRGMSYSFGLHKRPELDPGEIEARRSDRALKLAHRVQGNKYPGGENKFLESIVLWIDVLAPRYWWQEADTYRVGSSKQSESTMHTILHRALEQSDFVEDIHPHFLDLINERIAEKDFRWVKRHLPESFLQLRLWCINYKTLQNIWYQRHNHRLPEWHVFLDTVLAQIKHPELIVPAEQRVEMVEQPGETVERHIQWHRDP